MPAEASAQVVTRDPGGGGLRRLGDIGPVVNLKWSSALPGGPAQMSCTLQVPATTRDPGLAAGRQVQVYPGAAPVWDGQLDEPSPGEDGLSVTAHGTGTFGSQFQADYTGHSWGAHSVDDAVGNAIARGLRWAKGAGLYPLPDGAWLGQAPDQGQDKVSDLLDLVCSRGGLTWQVSWDGKLSIVPWPVKVTRLLVATTPVGRTLAGVVNAVCVRYCSKADSSTGSATYATTWAESPVLIGEYGRNEQPMDLSNAGVLTADKARAVGAQALKQYIQAAWAGPFTVTRHDYLTAAGTPVDLRCEQAGEVAQLLLADYGGQVGAAAPVFPAGTFEYDDESGTAVVTPAGAWRADWSSLVASLTEYRTVKGDPLGLKSGAA